MVIGNMAKGLYINEDGKLDDELASKATSNELRSAMYFSKSQRNVNSQNRILVPLMVLVDYCGFRVLCSSLVPLKKCGENDDGHGGDHIYGSRDAGKTVYDGSDDPIFQNRIKNKPFFASYIQDEFDNMTIGSQAKLKCEKICEESLTIPL